MNKFFSILLLVFSFSCQLYAESLEKLAGDFSKYQKAQNYAKLITTSDKIIELFLEREDFGLAEKFSLKIRDATQPHLSKYGYYLLGKTYHNAYLKLKKDDLLDKAITNYKASIYSDNSAILASLQLEELQKKSGLDEYAFLEKVKKLGGNIESDRLLRASYKHIKNGRWDFVKNYLDKNLIDVNTKLSSDGTTLLHMAVWYNEIIAASDLVQKYGAKIDVKDKEGDTPLKYAKHKNFRVMVSLLELEMNK